MTVTATIRSRSSVMPCIRYPGFGPSAEVFVACLRETLIWVNAQPTKVKATMIGPSTVRTTLPTA